MGLGLLLGLVGAEFTKGFFTEKSRIELQKKQDKLLEEQRTIDAASELYNRPNINEQGRQVALGLMQNPRDKKLLHQLELFKTIVTNDEGKLIPGEMPQIQSLEQAENAPIKPLTDTRPRFEFSPIELRDRRTADLRAEGRVKTEVAAQRRAQRLKELRAQKWYQDATPERQASYEANILGTSQQDDPLVEVRNRLFPDEQEETMRRSEFRRRVDEGETELEEVDSEEERRKAAANRPRVSTERIIRPGGGPGDIIFASKSVFPDGTIVWRDSAGNILDGNEIRPAPRGEGLTRQESIESAKSIARAVRAGRRSPFLKGMRSAGTGIRVAAELENPTEPGVEPFDVAGAERDYLAVRRYVQTLNSTKDLNLRRVIRSATGTTEQVAMRYKRWHDLMVQLAPVLPDDFKLLNQAALFAAAQGALNEFHPELQQAATELISGVRDFGFELATIYAMGNSPTDKALENSFVSLNENWGPQAFEGNLNMIRENLKIRQRSVQFVGPGGVDRESPYLPPGLLEPPVITPIDLDNLPKVGVFGPDAPAAPGRYESQPSPDDVQKQADEIDKLLQ